MRSIPSLVAAFGALTASASAYALQGAPASDNTARINALVQKLKTSDVGERFAAVLALKKMGPDATAAIPALADVSKNDPEPEIRELARKCIDVDALAQKLKSSHVGERFAAVLALRKMGPDARAAIPVLADMSKNDPEPEIRESAKKCLDVVREPIFVPFLQSKEAKEASEKEHQRQAVEEFKRAIQKQIKEAKEASEKEHQRQAVEKFRRAVEKQIKEASEKEEEEEPDNHYGIVTIHNKTEVAINYSYRVGEGAWRQATINPGERDYYWHEYDFVNENASPPFEIRFDSDLGPGVAWRTYALDRCAAPRVDPELGRDYDFIKHAGADLIDIYGR